MSIRDWLPPSKNAAFSVIFGYVFALMYLSQFVFGWFGVDIQDWTFYSVILIFLASESIAFAWYGYRRKRREEPFKKPLAVGLVVSILVITTVLLLTGTAMRMDTTFDAGTGNLGVFYGLPILGSPADELVSTNVLAQWGIGLKIILKALALIMPFLCSLWGGLSVLTADNLTEARGGLLAIAAAIVVVIITFLFNLVGIITA